jgi:hypothetical protein
MQLQHRRGAEAIESGSFHDAGDLVDCAKEHTACERHRKLTSIKSRGGDQGSITAVAKSLANYTTGHEVTPRKQRGCRA